MKRKSKDPKTKVLQRRTRGKPLVRRGTEPDPEPAPAPRSDGRRGTLRMLESILHIHELLKPGRPVPTRRLQEELGASRSTVLRNIAFMRDRLNADIDVDPTGEGYQYRGNPISLPDPMLTEGDLIALYIATPILEQYRGTDLGEQFASSFQKIVALLPERTRNRMFIPRRVEVKARVPTHQDARTFGHVLNALHQEHQLEIVYAPAYRTGTSRRVIDPYSLCVVNSKWYLLAYDYNRHQILSFAVERMWEAKELRNNKFERPRGFTAADHLKDAFGIYQPPKDSGEAEQEISIKFDSLSARYVKETKWHETQQVKKAGDGSIELTIRVRGTVEVERFVLAWGEHAEVLAPPALRRRMQERLKQTLSKYEVDPR